MTSNDWDIFLHVKFESFDKSEICQKKELVLGHAQDLPAKANARFVNRQAVPHGGFIEVIFSVKRGQAAAITLLSEHVCIPVKGWARNIGWAYNGCQKAIQHIPIIGKPLEKIAPDAYQNLRVNYEVEVANDGMCKYVINLKRDSGEDELLTWEGTAQI